MTKNIPWNKGLRQNYISLSIEKEFIAAIKKYINDKPTYRSVADFARQAMREKMEKDGS